MRLRKPRNANYLANIVDANKRIAVRKRPNGIRDVAVNSNTSLNSPPYSPVSSMKNVVDRVNSMVVVVDPDNLKANSRVSQPPKRTALRSGSPRSRDKHVNAARAYHNVISDHAVNNVTKYPV